MTRPKSHISQNRARTRPRSLVILLLTYYSSNIPEVWRDLVGRRLCRRQTEEARNENSVVTDLLCVDVIFQHLICGIPNLYELHKQPTGNRVIQVSSPTAYGCLQTDRWGLWNLHSFIHKAYSVSSSFGQLTEITSSSQDCSSPLGSCLTFSSGLVWRVPIFSVVLRMKLETLQVKYQKTNLKKISLLTKMENSVPSSPCSY